MELSTVLARWQPGDWLEWDGMGGYVLDVRGARRGSALATVLRATDAPGRYAIVTWRIHSGDLLDLRACHGIHIDATVRQAMLLAPVGTTATRQGSDDVQQGVKLVWRLTFPGGEQA